MAKFHGPIGYAVPTETRPGIWEDVITARNSSGDVLKNSRQLKAGEDLNDDLVVNNQISIIANPFATLHFHMMRYVKWMGAYWKITNVEVKSPRLILTLGGVYNGPVVEPEASP
jgi:hypothetical protein